MGRGSQLKKWLCLGGDEPRARCMALVFALVHLLALSILLLVLIAAVVSRQILPFYGWISETPVEDLGRRVTVFVRRQDATWRRRLIGSFLLRDEARARNLLIAEMERVRPTHAVVLRNGRALFGSLHRSADNNGVCLHCEDIAGTVQLVLRDDDIAWQKKIVYPEIVLLPDDVRFLLDYQNLRHYYLPPYLVVANVPYAAVHAAFEILSQLANEFLENFGVLVSAEQRVKPGYVCFFRDEVTFLACAVDKGDVNLAKTIGFYSEEQDCLFVYDRLQSFARGEIDLGLDRVESAVADIAATWGAESARELIRAERSRLYRELWQQVVTTLRHEGTHQLAFTLGVHSDEQIEHLWLVEGLAQYCESQPIGRPQADKMLALQAAARERRLIPWQELVDCPATDGFERFDDRLELAYAQAWFMFYHLMQPSHRARFLRYLDQIRRLPHEERDASRSELLAACLKTTRLKLCRELNQALTIAGAP